MDRPSGGEECRSWHVCVSDIQKKPLGRDERGSFTRTIKKSVVNIFACHDKHQDRTALTESQKKWRDRRQNYLGGHNNR